MPSAIATGYRKGIGTIIDANVIVLITAFILFVLSTAGVKGFAFTLGVGTIASLFTAVVFTQAFLGLFGRSGFMKSQAFLGGTVEERVRWHFDFMGLSKYFFSFSGVILLVAALSFATLGLTWGSTSSPAAASRRGWSRTRRSSRCAPLWTRPGIPDAEITEATSEELGANVIQIEADIEPEQVQQIQPALEADYGIVPDGFDSQSIGPTFGEQVARSAVYAIIFSLLVICAYVAFRFEPKYAVPVIIAVIHDILITGGVYSLSEREVTSGTVAAFLTILGYSLYDTVIVFDRIRENVPRLPRATFSQIVNRSMSEVLTRSLITGLSSVFLVSVLYIFGGATLQDFAFAMLVGIASGTYSSIFIAAPVLTAWKEREPAYRRRRERIEEQMGTVPPFPEENVISRLEGPPETGAAPPEPEREPEPPPRAPEPAAPAHTSAVPGVLPDQPAPVTPPPAPDPQPPEPSAPVRETEPAPADAATSAPTPEGDGEDAREGDGLGDKPELSEASAAALRRIQGEGGGGRKGKRRKRKHGRNR